MRNSVLAWLGSEKENSDSVGYVITLYRIGLAVYQYLFFFFLLRPLLFLELIVAVGLDMPALSEGRPHASEKRKIAQENGARKKRSRTAVSGKDQQIQQLEEQISESRKYYNNIVTLLSMLNGGDTELTAAVSLCRVFCRLIARGNLSDAGHAQNEKIIVAWLRERCQDYQKALLAIVREGEASVQVYANVPSKCFDCILYADCPGLDFVHALDP